MTVMLPVIVFLQNQRAKSKKQLKRRLFLDIKHKIDADVRTCITA